MIVRVQQIAFAIHDHCTYCMYRKDEEDRYLLERGKKTTRPAYGGTPSTREIAPYPARNSPGSDRTKHTRPKPSDTKDAMSQNAQVNHCAQYGNSTQY